MGGGVDGNVAASAGQNCSGMTPWGMYMKASRTGGLRRDSAQPMVSSRGRAGVAPNPRRQVRRSISSSLRIGRSSWFVDPAIRKGIAGHDGDHQRLHPVAVLGDRGRQLIDDDLVVAFQLAAER